MEKKPLLYRWGIFALVLTLAGLSCLWPGESAEAKSLWVEPGGSERGFFADRKASGVGDIVTIVISESTSILFPAVFSARVLR